MKAHGLDERNHKVWDYGTAWCSTAGSTTCLHYDNCRPFAASAASIGTQRSVRQCGSVPMMGGRLVQQSVVENPCHQGGERRGATLLIWVRQTALALIACPGGARTSVLLCMHVCVCTRACVHACVYACLRAGQCR